MKNSHIAVLMAAAAAVLLLRLRQQQRPGDDQTVFDTIGQTMDEAIGALAPGPAADMSASDQVRAMLKSREQLRLKPYNLGDGGWTVGYGHWESDPAKLPVLNTNDDADALFDKDLNERAEKWVRLYVKVPVTQYEYDALVHVAYNLSPKGFKKFADAVNAGEGIAGIAADSVAWVNPSLQHGIQARRDEEVALFETGAYA